MTIQGTQTILARIFLEFIQNFMQYSENAHFYEKQAKVLFLWYSSILSVQVQFIHDVEHLPSNYMKR